MILVDGLDEDATPQTDKLVLECMAPLQELVEVLKSAERRGRVLMDKVAHLEALLSLHQDRWNVALKGFSDQERASWKAAYPGLD